MYRWSDLIGCCSFLFRRLCCILVRQYLYMESAFWFEVTSPLFSHIFICMYVYISRHKYRLQYMIIDLCPTLQPYFHGIPARFVWSLMTQMGMERTLRLVQAPCCPTRTGDLGSQAAGTRVATLLGRQLGMMRPVTPLLLSNDVIIKAYWNSGVAIRIRLYCWLGCW